MRRTPLYFVLCKTEDRYRAYTTSRRPSVIYFEGKVNLREYDEVISLISIVPIATPHLFAVQSDKSNIHVYKSNIQKCVRRQLTDQAVRSSYSLMSIDVPTFLRRLPIIILEDVIPISAMIPLVWWMMATTKKYKLSDDEVSYILGIVYQICQIPTYQIKGFEDDTVDPLSWSRLTPMQKDLLWSMEFRKSYGGMVCDRNMIHYIQRNWISRLEKNDILWETYKNIDIPQIDLSSMRECNKDDVILEGIDYHCFPWMINKLMQSHPTLTERQIKGAIWFYRSRINFRTICHDSLPMKVIPELEDVYLKIKEDVNSLCIWIHCKKIL